ncbi:hypothetical protein ACFQVA_39085 [Actinomadura keratinilytica]
MKSKVVRQYVVSASRRASGEPCGRSHGGVSLTRVAVPRGSTTVTSYFSRPP